MSQFYFLNFKFILSTALSFWKKLVILLDVSITKLNGDFKITENK